MRPLLSLLFLLVTAAFASAQSPQFRVTLDPAAADGPRDGRLVVLLIREGAKLPPDTVPIEGPFWFDPQPLFGTDLRGLAPGAATVVDGQADGFPMKSTLLPPGQYRAQARLHVQRDNSDWKRHDGNLFGPVASFEIKADSTGTQTVELRLDQKTTRQAPKLPTNTELFRVRSERLSAFHGRDVFLQAAVSWPEPMPEPATTRKFAAVYRVPGFGGDYSEGLGEQNPWRRTLTDADADLRTLRGQAFSITLDPESPNGHTLFADSANNGPYSEALVKELIPALEAKFPLIAEPSARMARGHSSGGWTVLWMALNSPETFGTCWSSAPDPVDFRRFQQTDIYAASDFFTIGTPAEDTPSFRRAGSVLMSVRQEVGGENIVGPRNTGAGQWASWQAVWGPKAAEGHPAALFDPITGIIDRVVAEQYRRFDLRHLLRSDPARYANTWRNRIRLVVGDQDNFYLHEAVALIKADVEALPAAPADAPPFGYIKIVPGRDHGTLMSSPELRVFPSEMLAHLRAAGHVR